MASDTVPLARTPVPEGAARMTDYTELHARSAFSLLDGAASPEQLVAQAAALGLPALALTDRDDLGGAVRFAEAARAAGIGGIVGAEVTVRWDDAAVAAGGLAGMSELRASSDELPHLEAPVVLLAETREGYGHLCTLLTHARLDQPRGRPAVTPALLAAHTAGLFCLTAGSRGPVDAALRAGDALLAARRVGWLREVFDGRVALECHDHGLPEERRLAVELQTLARTHDLPWVVTNDVHYAAPDDRRIHDVLCALRHGLPLDAMGTRLPPNGEWHLKTGAMLAERWGTDCEGLRATRPIAERCAFRLADLRPRLPHFPLPPGVGEDEYLARLVAQGARERWGRRGVTPRHEAQLRHELAMIARLGFAGFFLIVWDLVRFARREGILCQGRGSAANSAVCYCLGITAVDPVKLELLFERFLSEDRQEAPDIDIDFAHRDRERVLQYVYQRYGRGHAAMVCEQITWRGRSAVRDAARVLGFTTEQGERLAMYADRFSARATAAALRGTGTADVFAPDEQGQCGPSGGGSTRRPSVRKATDPAPASGSVAKATRPGDPAKPRGDHHGPSRADGTHAYELRDAEKWRLAQARLAETQPAPFDASRALGDAMVRGTEAATRAREVRTAARRVQPAYEVHGSASAQQTSKDFDPTTRVAYDAMPSGGALRRGSRTLAEAAGLDPRDPRVALLADVVDGLHQLPRHRSIHVGGFVLTEEPLHTVVPIEPAAMADRTVIQWEKDDLDPVGLAKIDCLGLGILTLIQDCLQYVRRTRGVVVDLAQLDMADQAVYDMLCRADTIGVFQVESRAQMNTLPRLKPRCFYDLVVEVALIRPGPIQGEMVHPYLRRRAGTEPVTYPHPTLEPILKRTLGVPLFQEQGMQVAITAAGFTPGEADQLRRAMGHKRSRERMAEICERLVTGMAANGIPEETARRIYQQINAFADYGFPESHAASFALLVYASAYLKHYYAPEFTCALLNAQPMGFYAPGTIIEDARRHGVQVRPVDLRISEWDSTLERAEAEGEPAHASTTARTRRIAHEAQHEMRAGTQPRADAPVLRLGLRLVRGLGARARARLEAARAEGPFRSVHDVVARARLDRGTIRALAEAGAFDGMFAHLPPERRRRAALWEALAALRGDAGPLAPSPVSTSLPPSPPMTTVELTAADYRLTGLSLLGHPMKHLRADLRKRGVRMAAELLRHGEDGEPVVAAGLVICRQRPGTAKGFVFLTLEDESGLLNLIVTPKRFEQDALLFSRAPLLLVRGTLQVEGTVVNVRVAEGEALDVAGGAEHARGRNFH
jgi:error-prone DNA polymerase